ncbi:MAG: CDP-diacylglycerol--serine O-phosphatidyltransferase [Acidobacteria bacterium]|nr:CDP-diacylglycerol--serine O-phosphatidyltransferase [Acidobacteriota bacterium]
MDTNEKFYRRRPDLRKGVYIVPSLLTTANIFCGFYSVLEALKGFQKVALSSSLGNDLAYAQAAVHHFDIAAICIGFSVLFDFLDGRIARMTNTTSEFGVELDSLADVLSFGIAPAVLAYTWGYSPIVDLQKVGWAVSFMFLVCGALRLARFNVLARKPVQDKSVKKYFVGMPIPAGASLIAAIVHFTPIPIIMRKTQIDILGINLDSSFYSVLLMMLTAVLGLLMVSTIRYSNFKNTSGKPGMSKYQAVLLASVMVMAIYQWSQVVLLIMATCYVSLGPVAKILSLLTRSSSEDNSGTVSTDVSLNQQSNP